MGNLSKLKEIILYIGPFQPLKKIFFVTNIFNTFLFYNLFIFFAHTFFIFIFLYTLLLFYFNPLKNV